MCFEKGDVYRIKIKFSIIIDCFSTLVSNIPKTLNSQCDFALNSISL